jgi:cephalosporin hydroxylase
VSERILVCVIGQTRAHELTWESFKLNVLDELNADLAVCVGYNEHYDIENPFFQSAKYRWLIPEQVDFGIELDRISLTLGIPPKWEKLTKIGGHFLGGVRGIPGSGALQMIFRWYLCEGLCREHLLDTYDQFVITRSDFVYTAPHPTIRVLDPRWIWLPDGEDYGGLVDRHTVVSRKDVVSALSVIEDLLRNPDDWTEILPKMPDQNIECTLYRYFEREGLLSRLRRFPYIMYSVRGAKDSSRWSQGVYDQDTGQFIKYPREHAFALEAGKHYKSQADWLVWSERKCLEPATMFRRPVATVADAVEFIENCSISQLLDVSWLEHQFLPRLGFNNEYLNEFPESLYPFCGGGLLLWQYPNQFAPYLIKLSQMNLSSYLEIGSYYGGSFIITCEYLRRFKPLQRCVAIDPYLSPAIEEYRQLRGEVVWVGDRSTSAAALKEFAGRRWDYVFVDGDHDVQAVCADYEIAAGHAKYVGFHDIVSDTNPGVARMWRKLSIERPELVVFEMTDQYPEIQESLQLTLMGLGIVEANSGVGNETEKLRATGARGFHENREKPGA